MRKKGQAAMKFIMTYGWIILAAIILIAVLAYLRVSPTGSAVVTPPFYISTLSVSATNGITLEIRNDGEENYTIKSVSVSNCGTKTMDVTSTTDSLASVTINCTSAPTTGDSFKGDITISYLQAGSTVQFTSIGKISEKVTA